MFSKSDAAKVMHTHAKDPCVQIPGLTLPRVHLRCGMGRGGGGGGVLAKGERGKHD